MKLSEQMRTRITFDLPVDDDTIDDWADEAAQLEAKLESVECGECGKNLLECNMEECDRIAEERR